jgi:transposase
MFPGTAESIVFGVSGRLMLRALADGEDDAEKLVGLARGSLKGKKPELRRALTSRLTPAQRFVLKELLLRLAELEAATPRVSEQIIREIAGSVDPFVPEAVKLLQTIPGIGQRVAEVIVSEIGVDMTRFPTDARLASWAGTCPGNNESAGKRRSGQTTKGSPYLRAAVTQAAWGSSSHEEHLSCGAISLADPADGQNKALVAVGHSLLVIIYHVLAQRAYYRELGGDYFDRQYQQTQQQRLVRKLEAMGLKVTVETLSKAA